MTKDKDCTTLKYRVTQLETNYLELHESMRLILENLLPHIDTKLEALNTKITVATILNIGTIILAGVLLKSI